MARMEEKLAALGVAAVDVSTIKRSAARTGEGQGRTQVSEHVRAKQVAGF